MASTNSFKKVEPLADDPHETNLARPPKIAFVGSRDDEL
jgi:hypothetical protein